MVEEQLQLERAREAELETLYREEAARQWQKRENQWQREAEARERLMREVLEGRELSHYVGRYVGPRIPAMIPSVL